ncbi:MAG: hypothetical protein HQ464_01260 [Planctomycetes bacterium]|nr:hypothetical protein [Planctomycetota bacterium]
MTWHTELGDRCLTGPEARLVREIVDYMHDEIAVDLDSALEADDDGVEYGVTEFDKLKPPQKLALLEQVLRQMINATDAPPTLNVMNESAIAAMYVAVGERVAYEIDMESDVDEPGSFDPYHWRKLLLDVARTDESDPGELPTARCRDEDEWECLLDSISMRVLWDDDCMDSEVVLDATPDSADHYRWKFGIELDYFVAVAPDPKESEAAALRERLRALCRQT